MLAGMEHPLHPFCLLAKSYIEDLLTAKSALRETTPKTDIEMTQPCLQQPPFMPTKVCLAGALAQGYRTTLSQSAQKQNSEDQNFLRAGSSNEYLNKLNIGFTEWEFLIVKCLNWVRDIAGKISRSKRNFHEEMRMKPNHNAFPSFKYQWTSLKLRGEILSENRDKKRKERNPKIVLVNEIQWPVLQHDLPETWATDSFAGWVCRVGSYDPGGN